MRFCRTSRVRHHIFIHDSSFLVVFFYTSFTPDLLVFGIFCVWVMFCVHVTCMDSNKMCTVFFFVVFFSENIKKIYPDNIRVLRLRIHKQRIGRPGRTFYKCPERKSGHSSACIIRLSWSRVLGASTFPI